MLTNTLSAIRLRRAKPTDLEALLMLEEASFSPERRDRSATIQRSLQSPHQEVWIAEADQALAGAIFLRLFPQSLRIYSLAVARSWQGRGIGQALVQQAIDSARTRGAQRLLLEMDSRDEKLRAWYGRLGFVPLRLLPDYYDTGWHALKLVLRLSTGLTR